MDAQDIENRGVFHPVKDGQAEIYEEVRGTALAFAKRLNELLPDSREKTLAVGYLLDEVVMLANASVARHT